MSNLTDSFIQAFDIISQSNITNTDKTITISAIVKEVIDSSAGIYTVEYLNNTFKAFSSGNKYIEGDKVYVIIPNGNFSEAKFIIGSANPVADTSSSIVISDKYIYLSSDLFKPEKEEYALCSYKNEVIEISDFLTVSFVEILLTYV